MAPQRYTVGKSAAVQSERAAAEAPASHFYGESLPAAHDSLPQCYDHILQRHLLT